MAAINVCLVITLVYLPFKPHAFAFSLTQRTLQTAVRKMPSLSNVAPGLGLRLLSPAGHSGAIVSMSF